MEWAMPACRAYLQRLAGHRKVVRYDCRGAGLSDREIVDYSLEAQILDLEAVVDRLRLDQYAIFGFGHLGLAAIMYAARSPERVSHLILWCSYARASDYSGSDRVQAARSLIARDWELYTELEGYRSTRWQGGPMARMYSDYVRGSVSPAGLTAAFEAIRDADVSDLLAEVRAPTLVMHRVESRVPDVHVAKELAARIPNAQLALMEGSALAPFLGDVDAVVRAIDGFLSGPSGGLLTEREIEILGLLATGLSSREIGRELDLSVRTVERHITNIYRKIDAHGRAQATAYAFEHGLVRPR
jgi:pimeloyl-ACP methyl ester carboxylesterase/DNA-binding CsgD family transcriptional regulator